MRITFGPTKRDKALSERGLDFDDAALIFAGVTLEVEGTRKDYDETRVICQIVGRVDERCRLPAAWRGSLRF